MKIFEKIANMFKHASRKDSLRDKCVAAYGEEFGEMYDMVCSGQPIGGLLETTMFLEMIEAVKKGEPLTI